MAAAITTVTGYATDILGLIVADDTLKLFVAFPLVFGAIGLVKSLVGRM